ncbi:MAG: hypothetical protein N3D75_03940 [Candidatus Aenigmarchaeota archaeon]|nr:hypothetical protein [Candidatus Aenigmarchaeota archaeon]
MIERGTFTFLSNSPDLCQDQLYLLAYFHLKSLYLLLHEVDPSMKELNIRLIGYKVERLGINYKFQVTVEYLTPALWSSESKK